MGAPNPLLQKVQIGRRALGLDDDTYRDLLKRVAGISSAKGASDGQLILVVNEMKRLGFSDQPRKDRDPPSFLPQAAKARALWLSLYQLGVLRSSSDRAFKAWAKSQLGIGDFSWANGKQLRAAIEALKSWAERFGYIQANEADVDRIVLARRDAGLDTSASLALAPRIALIEAQWARLVKLGAFETWPALGSFLSKHYGVAAPAYLSVEQADAVIRRLGIWINRVRAPEPMSSQASDG